MHFDWVNLFCNVSTKASWNRAILPTNLTQITPLANVSYMLIC